MAHSPALSSAQRQHLRALAHPLAPVVQLGAAGLSEAVVTAIAEALRRHELIKVKLPKLDDAGGRRALADAIAERSAAHLVACIGRVVVLYRRRDKDLPGKPRIELPAATLRR